MAAMEAQIAADVDDCEKFAMESPDPAPEVAFQDLYSDAYKLEDVL